ncbi:MAG: hypothetical protein L0241_28910, partial [Planctomycetia bacterium]|nr:hypothetical protein [Planctomycetia bacterium]
GSTLNFANLNPGGGVVETTITGAGTLLLNGLSEDGIFVRADHKVKKVAQVGSPGAVAGVDPMAKKLTLTDATAEWGYLGNGADNLALRVINNGGKFHLGSLDPVYGAAGRAQVTITMTGGDVNTPAYTQSMGTARLELMSGCVMDVSATKGALVSNGYVWMMGNTDLAAEAQTTTIKGTYTMTGGSLGFPFPIQIGDNYVFGKFKVDGNVNWSGGTYVPGVNCAANQAGEAHRWIITGTMTVDASGQNKPKIVPTPQFLPPGQQPNGTWNVIVPEGQNAKVEGDTPTVEAGWMIEPIMEQGVKKGYKVKK